MIDTIGPYRVLGKLGEGGMGVVFRSRESRLQRDVALKLLPEHFAHDAVRLPRFEREAQVLASLNHPNIAQIYGLEQVNESACIVMEMVEGETLEEKLKKGPLPVDEAVGMKAYVPSGHLGYSNHGRLSAQRADASGQRQGNPIVVADNGRACRRTAASSRTPPTNPARIRSWSRHSPMPAAASDRSAQRVESSRSGGATVASCIT